MGLNNLRPFNALTIEAASFLAVSLNEEKASLKDTAESVLKRPNYDVNNRTQVNGHKDDETISVSTEQIKVDKLKKNH